MKATTRFIEDAIKGGWKAPWQAILRADEYTGRPIDYIEEVVLLDPLAWKAVEKARGWDNGEHVDPTYEFASSQTWMWQWKWHRFIDHLADGLTIEEALEKISN